MTAVEDAIKQLARTVAEHGVTPSDAFLPYEDLCELKGVPLDPWVPNKRALVHVTRGEWHWLSACTSECPR